jgi:pimeloyl-ACP methyl ester carboxylesterase
MRRTKLVRTCGGLVASVLLLAGCAPARIQAAGPGVGIVLMHGKWSRPPTPVVQLARLLGADGYTVVTPEMPWSERRLYDVDYPGALAEIEAAVRSLRAGGVARVIVAGHSFGANAAIAYAGSGREVDGLIALAPGHVPDLAGFRTTVGASVERARAMIADGKAADRAEFTDLNQGRTRTIRTTAKIYHSYFDPEGMAAMPKSAAMIPRPIPFLWVVGTRDSMLRAGEAYAFNRAPPHPKSKYLVVESDHGNTPNDARDDIVRWLASLRP